AFENSTTGEVKAFAFDGALTALTTSVITVASTTNTQRRPATCWNSVEDEYLVVYQSDQVTSGEDQVYGRRFEPAAGTVLGDAFAISEAAEKNQEPDVAFSPETATFQVVWNWYEAGSGNLTEVNGQEVTAAGMLRGDPYGVALGQRDDRGDLAAAVAYGAALKETLCVWPDTSDPEADVDIYGRRIETGDPMIQQEPVHNAIRLGGNGSVLGHSGEFVWTVPVAQIAGVGFPFEFTATYRSGATVDGAIGFGWDHSLNLGIQFSGTAGASDATFFDGTGRRFTYDWNGTGWDTPAGLYNTLTWASSTPVLTDRHGTVYTFGRSAESSFYDGRRLLTSVADRNGNTLTITYLSGDDHRIDTVTDTRGETIDFAWTQDKRLESITDWADRVWSFEYDGAGDLVATTTPATSAYPYGNRTSYTYAGSQPKSWLDHNLVVISSPNNQQFLINNFEPLTDRVDSQQYGTGSQVY
ncbi:MAG: RHS repeat protein, partial [Phycisphaeraceae bacterium]|nr:RHS repeat protein [Phycisphaeraceae bacterium]